MLLKYRARHKPNETNYDVIYVGMAGSDKGSIKGRLRRHTESKLKNREWSHFSVFEVHDNTTEEEIRELEALFRIMFKKDSHANKLNIQKGSGKLNRVRIKRIEKWAPKAAKKPEKQDLTA